MNNFESEILSQTCINNSTSQAWSFASAPTLHPMKVTINLNRSGTQSANPNLPAGDPEPDAYFQILNQNYKVIKKLEI